MREAVDSKTKLIVNADQAHNDGRLYKCRVCSERVQLHKNTAYGSYFQHWHGTRREDCENYRAGTTSESLKIWQAVYEIRNRASLYAVFENSAHNKSWGLELYIPSSIFTPGMDCIIIRDAIPAPVKLLPSQSDNNLGCRVKVSPKEKYYINEDISGSISNYELVSELYRDKYNIFNCNDSGGRKLGDDTPLIRGNTYIIIVHKDKNLPIVEDSLCLGKQGDWESFVYTVPELLTEQEQLFLEESLDRNIISPGIRISLVTPAESKNTPFGGLIVPEDRNIILAVTGLEGQMVNFELAIKSSIGGMPRYQVEGQLPLYLNMGEFSAGIYDIFVSAESIAHLTLVIESFQIFEPKTLSLEFTEVSGEHYSIPLFSEVIYKCLDGVRKRTIAITGIQIPYPVNICLTIYNQGFSFIDECIDYPIFRNYREQWKIKFKANEQALIDRINAVVQHNQGFILDMGNFGKLRWEPVLPDGERKSAINLPNHVKKKIKWLCSIRSFYSHNTISSRYINGAIKQEVIQLLSAPDKKLIQSLVSGQGWDVRFAGHINSLIKQINDIRMR